MNVKDLNRLKLVLVEKKEQAYGWQDSWECLILLCRNGAVIPLSQHSRPWIR